MVLCSMEQISLTEAYATHDLAIDALRASLGASAPSYAQDRLWLLRYVLSYPESSAAAEAARKALTWRAANPDILMAAAAGGSPPHAALILPHIVAGFHGTSKLGEPLFIVRAGLSWPPAVAAAASQEQIVEFLMFWRERAHLLCDAASRERGKIVRMIAVIAMTGVSMSAISHKFNAAQAAAGRLSEFLYPQLLLRNVGHSPPPFFHGVFALIRPLIPAKMLARFTLCPGRASGVAPGTLPATACPFVSTRFDVETLPSFLGGGCHCIAAGGCVGGAPNAETKPAPKGGPRSASVSVPARGSHDIVLAVRRPGAHLLYDIAAADGRGGGDALHGDASVWLTPGEGSEALPLPLAHTGAVGAGTIALPAAGTVVLRLSNPHNLFAHLHLVVTARVEEEAASPSESGSESIQDVTTSPRQPLQTFSAPPAPSIPSEAEKQA